MNDQIFQFIKKQTCASICCVDDNNNPYCFCCFYAFNSDEQLLYFKSSSAAKHSGILLKNPVIAGTIVPDRLNTLQVKGVQFEGILLPDEDPASKQATVYFYKKYPAALAMSGEIWTIQLISIKMTDSTLGFGKKITWKRETGVEH